MSIQAVNTSIQTLLGVDAVNEATKGADVVTARRRREIAEGKRIMIQNGCLPVPTQVSDPITDSQFSSKHRATIRAEAYREANEIWEMGKIIGLKSIQPESEIIQALVDMEERDKLQCKQAEEAGPGKGVESVFK